MVVNEVNVNLANKQSAKDKYQVPNVFKRLERIQQKHDRNMQRLEKNHISLMNSLSEQSQKLKNLSETYSLKELEKLHQTCNFLNCDNGPNMNFSNKYSKLSETESSSYHDVDENSSELNGASKSFPISGRTSDVWLSRERQKIEGTLRNIHSKCEKVSGEIKSARDGHVLTYLRAHTNDPVVTKDLPLDLVNKTNKKNSRFAFKPGCNAFVAGKSRPPSRKNNSVNTPSHANCIACQNNRSFENFNYHRKETAVPIVRWKFAPRGRYVEESMTYRKLINSFQSDVGPRSKINATVPYLSSSTGKLSELKLLSKSTNKNSNSDTITSGDELRFTDQFATLRRENNSRVYRDICKTIQCLENVRCERKVADFVRKLDSFSTPREPVWTRI